MKAGKLILLATAMMAVCHAKTLDVGGRSLTLPEPEGYVEVTIEMPAIYEAIQKMGNPNNEALGYYIPAEMADAAKAGGAIPPMKFFVLEVQGNTKFVAMGNADFQGMVGGVKSSNQMVNDELKSELGDGFTEAAVVALKGIAVLPPHRESKVSFGHSMLLNNVAFGSEGNDQVMAATKVYANAGGKVLLLTAYAPEKDLEWTRTATGAWTDAVISNNPGPPSDTGESGSSGYDPGQVDDGGFKVGLIGAVIGGVLVFLVMALKNRRK